MKTLTRILMLLCCSGLSLTAQANGTFRYCPASPVAAVSGDNVSPFELIWDVSDGTTSQGVKQSTELVIFVTPVVMPSSATPWGTVLGCKATFETARYDTNFLPKVKIQECLLSDSRHKAAAFGSPILLRTIKKRPREDGGAEFKEERG